MTEECIATSSAVCATSRLWFQSWCACGDEKLPRMAGGQQNPPRGLGADIGNGVENSSNGLLRAVIGRVRDLNEPSGKHRIERCHRLHFARSHVGIRNLPHHLARGAGKHRQAIDHPADIGPAGDLQVGHHSLDRGVRALIE